MWGKSHLPPAGSWHLRNLKICQHANPCIFFRFSANYFLFILLLFNMVAMLCNISQKELSLLHFCTRLTVLHTLFYKNIFRSSTLCLPPELDKRCNTLLVLPAWRSCDSLAKQMLLLNTIIYLAQCWRMLRLSCVNGSNVGVYAKNILMF